MRVISSGVLYGSDLIHVYNALKYLVLGKASITAWGFASVLGPQLISYIYDVPVSYAGAFYITAEIVLLSSIILFIVRPPKREASAPAGAKGRTQQRTPRQLGVAALKGIRRKSPPERRGLFR